MEMRKEKKRKGNEINKDIKLGTTKCTTTITLNEMNN